MPGAACAGRLRARSASARARQIRIRPASLGAGRWSHTVEPAKRGLLGLLSQELLHPLHGVARDLAAELEPHAGPQCARRGDHDVPADRRHQVVGEAVPVRLRLHGSVHGGRGVRKLRWQRDGREHRSGVEESDGRGRPWRVRHARRVRHHESQRRDEEGDRQHLGRTGSVLMEEIASRADRSRVYGEGSH